MRPAPAIPRRYTGPVLLPRAEPEPGPVRTAGLLFLATLLPRLAVFPWNENLYGDAVARTELAARWAQAPHWMNAFSDGAFQFGPLHLYLVGLALKLQLPAVDAGRWVSLCFGTLTVLPLHALTRRLFGWRAAVWAGLAFAVWGLHLQLSATAASEALGLFLTLWMAALLAQALQENTLGPLLGAAVVLNLACATRYDAWLFIPLICAVLLFRGEDRVAGITRAVVFGLVCLPFPLLWMHGNELQNGEALWPVRYVEEYHQRWFPAGEAVWGRVGYRLQNLFFWPGAALFTLSPLVAAFGAVGMVRSARNQPEHRWLVLLALVPTAYFTVRGAVLGNFVPLARFTVNQVVFLLPFLRDGFRVVASGCSAPVRKALLGALVLTAVVFPVALGWVTFRKEGKYPDSLRPISPLSTNPPAVMAVAKYLREQVAPLGPEASVALDTAPDFWDLQIAFFSGLPEERLVRRRWPSFPRRLTELEPRFLVRAQGGDLERQADVRLEPDALWLGERRYQAVPGFPAPYHVYRR